MLPMQRDEVVSELSQRFSGCLPAVDSRDASFAELALQHQRSPARLEHTLHRGAFGSVTDLVRPTLRTERQAQRVDDQRLAAARLAGQEVEAGPEADPTLRDQRQVADAEFFEHYFFGTSGRP